MGEPHVDALAEELTSTEVTGWRAYEQLEPWGEDRADLRTGILASLVANLTREKGQKPYMPADFMPDFEPKGERKPESGSLLKKALEVFGRFKQAPK